MKRFLLLVLSLLLLVLIIACAGAPEPSAAAEPEAIEAAEDEGVPDASSAALAPEADSAARKEARVADEELSLAREESPAGAATFGDGRTSAGKTKPPSQSGLSAGFADDNQQYGYFLTFLEEYRDAAHLELDVSERIVVRVTDADGKPVPNAKLRFFDADTLLVEGRTPSDGEFLFFPRAWGDLTSKEFRLELDDPAGTAEYSIVRNGPRSREVQLQRRRLLPDPPAVDILFVLDTTGSMGEEIQRLKTTIELIHLNLSSMPAAPAIRFGLVLYKDVGDEYRTRSVPLTDNLEKFQEALAPVTAGGGGDTPEDLEYALYEGVENMDWRPDGIRLMFVITDAPPQLAYPDSPAPYTGSAMRAQEEGIRIYSVGTGGLPLDGEYVLRQLAQFTGGRYIFLTSGEQGESEGGAPGSVSHHTGANFQTDKLESIIIRFAKEEIANLTDRPLEQPEDYFEATKIDAEEREETLAKLFEQAVEQLADFSTLGFGGEFAVAILPPAAKVETAALQAEYFGERLMMAARSSGRFTLVERQDLQSLLDEFALQLTGITEAEEVARIGGLLNAEGLITGNLFASPGSYELFLRLVRVETGEILSVTRARIDVALGL